MRKSESDEKFSGLTSDVTHWKFYIRPKGLEVELTVEPQININHVHSWPQLPRRYRRVSDAKRYAARIVGESLRWEPINQ